MIEKEIKIRINDKNKLNVLEKYVVSKGGVLQKEYVVVDEYFSHPCRDFKKTDEALRIRIQAEEVILTYKCSRISRIPKIREEISVKVSDYNAVRDILLKLGFNPLAKIVKYRKEYTLNNLRIFMDEVKELGYFVEIECDDENLILKFIDALKKMKICEGVEERTYLEMYLKLKSQRAK